MIDREGDGEAAGSVVGAGAGNKRPGDRGIADDFERPGQAPVR